MCFCRITQRHPATNRQNELAIAHVIGKLTQLGWIGLRAHARTLHCRILGAALSGKTAAYPKEPLCLCADLELLQEPREENASYIATWLEVLKNDNRAIFAAAAHAQRAADYLNQIAAAQVLRTCAA